MPLYEYRCDACGSRFEVIRKFSDPPLAVCTVCGKGPVEKLISSPAFQFKGSGFYITDYARKSEASGTSESGDSKSDKSERADRAEKAEKADKADKAEKAERKDPAPTDSRKDSTSGDSSKGPSKGSSEASKPAAEKPAPGSSTKDKP